MKTLCVVFSGIVLAFVACGCLSVEKKVYHVQLNPDGESGTATITFVNIFSSECDSTTVVKDFSELIDDYMQGKKIDSLYPDVSNLKKRLYQQDGKLYGEITFNFSHLQQEFLYRYDSQSPIMQYFSMINEKYLSSNGKFGGDRMPVVFWNNSARDLQLTTSALPNVLQDKGCTHSLLPEYMAWQQHH